MESRKLLIYALLVIKVFEHQTLATGKWEFNTASPYSSTIYRTGCYKNKIFMLNDNLIYEATSLNSKIETIWIFDLSTYSWALERTTGDNPGKRIVFSISIDPDSGSLYFFGGINPDGYYNDLYSLSLNTLEWRRLSPTGTLPGKRFNTYSFFYSKHVYILGGNTPNDLTDVWKYSPDSNTWSLVVDPGNTMKSMFMVNAGFHQGKYYIFGGCGVLESTCPARLIVFDADKSLWEPQVEYSFKSQNYASITIFNNTLYAMGGFIEGEFDLATLQITKIDIRTKAILSRGGYRVQESTLYPVIIPSGRILISTLLIGDLFYCFGGVNMASNNHFWIFNPKNDTWVGNNLHSYPHPRIRPHVTAISSTELAIFGGFYLNAFITPINDLWVFNTETNKWTRLSQESICPTTRYNCVPSLIGSSFSYHAGYFYVIGGFTLSIDISPVARKFDTGMKTWKEIKFQDSHVNSVLMRYMAASKMIGSKIYLWGGQNPTGDAVTLEVNVFNMNTEKMYSLGLEDSSIKSALDVTGLDINGQFCALGNITSNVNIKNSIWCYKEDVNEWQFLSHIPESIITKESYIDYYVNLIIFGGNTMKSGPVNQFIMFDAHENFTDNLQDYENPKNMYGGSSVVLNGVLYIFSGMTFSFYTTSSNALFNFKLDETWCSGRRVVTALDKKIEDGSGKFKYFPGTNCTWDIYNATHIRVDNINIGHGAFLQLENMDNCSQPIYINNKTTYQMRVDDLLQGSVIHIPSQRVRLQFEVAMDANTYDGFSLSLYDCNLGFELDKNGCQCSADRYINSLGDCIKCPPGTMQESPNQYECISEKASSSNFDTVETDALPGELIELSSYLPPLVQSSMATLEDTLYVVGGYSVIGDDNQKFSDMSTIYTSDRLYDSKWSRIQAKGDIPSPRVDSCFTSVKDFIVLIGGKTERLDTNVYHFDVKSSRWLRKEAFVSNMRHGSMCAEYRGSVFVYGGVNLNEEVSGELQVYNPGTQNISTIVTEGASPKLSFAGGGVWMSHLYLFGGWNGAKEEDILYTFDLENMRWVSNISVKLDSCIECDQDKGICDFSRQKMVSGVVGSKMHVYGGSSNGQVLADILVIDIGNGKVIKRENYGIFSPRFPLRNPPPKSGAAGGMYGNQMVVMGGIGTGGEMGNDVWSWDTDLLTWSDSSIFRIPIHRTEAGLLKDSETTFIIFGGSTIYIGETLLNDMWRYNTTSSSWILIERESNGEKPYGRAGAMMAMYDNNIYIFGGRTSVRIDDHLMWCYNIDLKKWTGIDFSSSLRANERPFNRIGSRSVQIGKHVWIWGGQLAMGLENVERYTSIFRIDLEKNIVESKSSKNLDPRTRRYFGMTQFSENTISIIGGESFNGNFLQDIWDLNMETMEWKNINIQSDEMKLSGFSTVSMNENIIAFGSSDIGYPAWMVQRGFGTSSPLFTTTQLLGYENISEQSGLVVNDIMVMFGGRRGSTLTNQIVAYKPGFCNPRDPMVLGSKSTISFFDDGSGSGMYLTNTNCSWNLPDATHISINFTIRSTDTFAFFSIIIFEGTDESASILHTIKQEDTKNYRSLTSSRGFRIHFQSTGDVGKEGNGHNNQPCNGCEGFVVGHIKCPNQSVLDADLKSCICESGYSKVDDVCQKDSKNTPDIMMGALIGGLLGVILIGLGLAGYRYKKKLSEMDQKEKQLYAHINFEDVEIGRKVGSGSFGDVYAGKWRGTDVAIKFISQKSLDKQKIESFKKEISIMVELRHPNILLYMGACFEEQHLCIICEFMHQGSLYEVLHEDKPINFNQKIQFLSDISKGMQYLHMSNPPIVHRDLKSLNILVDDRDRLKVSDFGLSVIHGSEKNDECIGSLMWLAPEVIRGDEYTIYADVYSAAIISWEILSRKDPYYEVENTTAVIHKVLMYQYRPPMPPNIPEEIKNIIISMWAQNPQERPTFQVVSKKIDAMMGATKYASKSMFSMVMDEEDIPPEGNLSVVSTHISGSDVLWEDIPDSMAASVMLMNKIMKEVVKKYKGYISQNDGENFVAIFQDSLLAIRFCSEAQVRLKDAEWPSELLECDHGRISTEFDLRGLQIQMGVDFGMCTKVYEKESKKWRFVGKSVSKSTKLSQSCIGGQIIISDVVYQDVDENLKIVEVENIVSPIHYNSTQNESKLQTYYQVTPKKIQKRNEYFGQIQTAGSSSAFRTMGSSSHQSTMPNQVQPFTDADQSSGSSPNRTGQEIKILNQMEASKNNNEKKLVNRKSWEINYDELTVGTMCVGSGSFGSVYIGEFKGRKVAIKKCIAGHNQTMDESLILFLMEVTVFRKLKHPNIVEFIGACKDLPNLVIVMEFVEPGSLYSLLRNLATPIGETEKTKIIDGIIFGMSYLHSNDPVILHRDLKSANILVNTDFQAKICDFGFARLKVNNRTMTKCGTMAYQAPEVMKGQRYNEKADVYSFGIILWEIETRESPYQGRNALMLHIEVINGLRPDIRSKMDLTRVSLMKRCWNEDETLRPTFQELAGKRIPNNGLINSVDIE